MKRVVIIQSVLKEYRIHFFDKLHKRLILNGIELRVIYGQPCKADKYKGDNVEQDPEYGIRVKNFWLFNERALLQPVLHEIISSDLVIVEQANKHLVNYMLMILSLLGLNKTAFWGHGWNRQAEGRSFPSAFKRKTLKFTDWWFAYTDGTKDYLVKEGFPEGKITSVQNSVDTKSIKNDLKSLGREEILNFKKSLGLSRDAKVGLFCGSLYKEKCLEFLINAAVKIREKIPEFSMLIVGDGPDRNIAEEADKRYTWIHYLGPRFGREKALCLGASDLFLMPGLVGLAILDAFAAGLPIVSTDIPFHSPEIEYLADGQNGCITEHNIFIYADKVAMLLADEQARREMGRHAEETGEFFTVERMAENFASGIFKVLNKPFCTIK